ncbi:MAG: thioesterase [Gammaproteobacteria bacterium]|nr:MAG: thioesterase [Gammaproteobacteria bacterium]
MFNTELTVNIDHINYGNHLGHDKLVTMLHEARLRFFDYLGQSEFDFYGIGLIMKSLTVNYRQESFRGDKLSFAMRFEDIRTSAFCLHYEVVRDNGDIIADANVVLVGFDYGKRRVAKLPDLCRKALTSG